LWWIAELVQSLWRASGGSGGMCNLRQETFSNRENPSVQDINFNEINALSNSDCGMFHLTTQDRNRV
jgi:hypothetical protein